MAYPLLSSKQMMMVNHETIIISYHYVPDVGHVGWDVELGAWVEVFLCAGYRWTQALVLQPQRRDYKIIAGM